MAGSSTVISGSGRGSSGSASVSPIMISLMPATAMMSPADAVAGRDPVERFGPEQLGDLDPLDGTVPAAPCGLLAPADLAVIDPAQRDPAQVGGGVQVGDVSLQRRRGVIGRRGHGA